MGLPFSRAQFFDVFAAYNTAVWPAQAALLLLAAGLLVLVLRAPARAGRPVAFGLAFLWAWMALAYHLAFFRAVNPAAPVFAALSLLAAAVFAWSGARGRLRFAPLPPARRWPGLVVVAYALILYPVAGLLAGHRYPAFPTFGLPCPTTLYTFGLLFLSAPGTSRLLAVVPLAWALVGTSAALLLGVPQDLGLAVAAAGGACWIGRRPARAGAA